MYGSCNANVSILPIQIVHYIVPNVVFYRDVADYVNLNEMFLLGTHDDYGAVTKTAPALPMHRPPNQWVRCFYLCLLLFQRSLKKNHKEWDRWNW